MIGDPLYEQIKRRREEKAASVGTPEARPEGVTIYRCQALIAIEEDDTTYTEGPAVDVAYKIGCGRTVEAKPYVDVPICHEAGMAIIDYDWERDVEA